MRDIWYIGPALLALARNLKAAECFRKSDLFKWCPEFADRSTTAHSALDHLAVLGFIHTTPTPVGRGKQGLTWYAITPDGVAAAKAAQAEAARQARARGALAMSASTRASSAFAARLWALLRMRQHLTAGDAAKLLTDAGDDFEQAKKRAATYLRTWAYANPKALQISAQRFDGFKRYVLLEDLGPSVPQVAIGSVYPKKETEA